MNENETIWMRLKNFRFITASLNQSVIENRLPFGMKRHLTPLYVYEDLPLLKASNFSLKDAKDETILSFKRIEPKIETNFVNKYKFIPHKVISACTSCVIKDSGREKKFDPLAILFFNPDFVRSYLTSNANGSVSNDKRLLGAILKQSCWLLSYGDLIKNDLNLPLIQNNKLRCLKYAEFVAEEWQNIKIFGKDVEFIAIEKVDDAKSDVYQVLKSTKGDDLHLFIIGKEGNLKFTTKHLVDFVEIDSILRINVKIESSDTIFMIRGGNNSNFEELLAGKNFAIFGLNEDFEQRALDLLKTTTDISALMISRLSFANEFDKSYIIDDDQGIKYVSHLDTKVGRIVGNPIPGPFGFTTRHSVVYRTGYFAALHHDASKINRFPDTINYIIRKMGNEVNLGRRMEQEGDESVLKRISDVQYFAYLLRRTGKYYLALGGGAKCLVLSKDLLSVTVYEVPILMEIPLNVHDQVILVSPHFPPAVLIKSIRAPTIQEWIRRLIQLSEVDVNSFKVSLAHFEIN